MIPTSATLERARTGRPRDPRVDDAVLRAVLDIVGEEGAGGLTVDAVAQRAGVGKATIYRRWTSKEAMLLDAWSSLVATSDAPDTGSLRDDLRALLRSYLGTYGTGTVSRAFPQLVALARVSPELQATLASIGAERRKPMRTVIERGQQRGEIRADLDLEAVYDLVTGPLFSRLLFHGGEAVSVEQLDAMLDIVLAGIAPA